jgi:hypothetical protein
MYFEEPEDKLKLKEREEVHLRIKTRVAVLFACYLVLILIIAKNDFSFVFGAESKIVPVCGPANTKKMSDDKELVREKCQKALRVNEEYFKKMPGYIEGKVTELPIGYKKNLIPVIQISFNKESPEHKKIPEEICGFEVQRLYK